MANANLIYQISSNQTTQAQFQYVMDIQNASRTVLQRIKQQPNPSGVGVFDVGQIITNYVGIDEVWKTPECATSDNANERFWIAFGEEYGASVSSSVVLYNGSGVAGSPAKSGSFTLTATNGLVEPNSGAWNFPSGSYVTSSIAPTGGSAGFTLQHGLSNAPKTQSIQDGEYATVALYNGNFDNSDTKAQDIYYIGVNVYNSAGSNIQNFDWFNITSNGGGPRVSSLGEWGDSGVYNAQNAGTNLIHFAAGPQNFADAGQTLNAAWDYYVISFRPQESAGIEDSSAYYAQYRFNKSNPECISDGVRFAWKNEFGVWDYYTARLAKNTSVQIERNSYQQSFVNFSNAAGTLPYNISRRGFEQFQNKLNQSFNVTTDILDQADADWLRELFFSTQVFVQEGTDFLPVVITDANVTEKTNKRSQKTFQYTFNYQYANPLRARL